MQLDKRMLERLLTMNDEQLADLIRSIATEAGIDPSQLGLNPDNVQSIRQALGGATDADVQAMNAVYNDYKQGRRNNRL